MPPVHVKVDGVWQVISRADASVRVAGAWQPLQQAWVKVNGAWEALYNNVVANISASRRSPRVGDSVRITWSSSNATSVSVTRDGAQISTSSSGSRTFSRSSAGSDTFAITATGPGGTATDFVTVRWRAAPPPPTASIWAVPANPVVNQEVFIHWSTTNATNATVFFEGVWWVHGQLSGSHSIGASSSPGHAETFSIEATGPGGTATGSVTVAWSAE